MNKQITSLGLVEVRGFISAVEVADAMIKSSEVRIYTYLKLNPGLITIIVEGDLGACESAVDAGAKVAATRGTLVSVLVKGKPDVAIESLLRGLLPVTAVAPVESPSVKVVENAITEQTCLAYLASVPNGKSVSDLKKHFKIHSKNVYAILKILEQDHKVERYNRRFRLSAHSQ